MDLVARLERWGFVAFRCPNQCCAPWVTRSRDADGMPPAQYPEDERCLCGADAVWVRDITDAVLERQFP